MLFESKNIKIRITCFQQDTIFLSAATSFQICRPSASVCASCWQLALGIVRFEGAFPVTYPVLLTNLIPGPISKIIPTAAKWRMINERFISATRITYTVCLPRDPKGSICISAGCRTWSQYYLFISRLSDALGKCEKMLRKKGMYLIWEMLRYQL